MTFSLDPAQQSQCYYPTHPSRLWPVVRKHRECMLMLAICIICADSSVSSINEAREQKSLLQTQESQLRQREEEVRSAMRRLAADQAELQRAWTELQRSKETTAAELRREREAIVNEKKQLATEREAYDVERRSYIADKERDRLKFESEVQSYLADKQALEANAKEASAQWQLLRQQQAALAADKERRAKPFAEVQPER